MAWTLTVDKFLWVAELKVGAWCYGGIQTCVVIYCLFINNLDWQGWIYFLLGAIPMMVSWTLLLAKMNDSQLWFYAWINWYFSFFVWILASIQTIIQTILLSIMIHNAG